MGEGASASRLIDGRIKELGDHAETLARVRALIKQADPAVIEEWPGEEGSVWSHAGIICTGETYKNVVKLTFAHGAALNDPSGLFNSSPTAMSGAPSISTRMMKTMRRRQGADPAPRLPNAPAPPSGGRPKLSGAAGCGLGA